MATNLNLLQQLTEAQIQQIDEQQQQPQAIMQTGIDSSASGPGEGLDSVDMPMLGAASGTPTPRSDCCEIFSDTWYRGDRLEICHDGVNKLTADLYNSPYHFNDVAGSWACGSNVRFTMCDNEHWRCAHETSSRGRINNPWIGPLMDNRLTSVTLAPYNVRTRGAVTLFADDGCMGNTAAFAYLGQEGGTEYLHTDLDDRDIGQDRASSIMVPFGYVAELYADYNFTGSHQKVVGIQYTDSGRMECIGLNSELNDKLSSMIVRPIRQGSSVGFWEPVYTVNTSFTYTVTAGITDTYGGVAENWERDMMNASMELGLEFEGIGGFRESISAEFEYGFRRTVTETTQIAQTEQIQLKCGENDGQGHGLWQWVVRTNDNSIISHSRNAVCRHGANFNNPPSCPWNACIDGECTQCRSGWHN